MSGLNIIVDESDEAYHAHGAIGRSGLWTIHTKSPAHFKFGEREESKAQALGKLAHMAILLPDLLFERYVVGPDVNKNTNAWKDAKLQAQAGGKELVDQATMDAALRMRDGVMAHPTLARLLGDGTATFEQSYYFDEDGVSCKVRPDWFAQTQGVLLDIKTSVSAMPRDFAKSCAAYGYHVQAAMYGRGVARVVGDKNALPMVFAVVEKDAPHLVQLFELDQDAVDAGERIYLAALQTYWECMQTGNWPGYPQGITGLSLPMWALQGTEDI